MANNTAGRYGFLIEAERRGLLSGENQGYLNEARRRGLLDSPGEAAGEPEPGYAPPEPLGPVNVAPERDMVPNRGYSELSDDEVGQVYRRYADQYGIKSEMDDPRHFYDYPAAIRAGARPDEAGHWPSEYKREGHSRMVVDGVNTKTGELVAPREASKALVRDMVGGHLKPTPYKPPDTLGDVVKNTMLDFFGGVIPKAGAGLIKGVTLGAVDPERGEVGIPFTSIRKKIAPPLGKSVAELGVSPEIAENPYIQMGPEFTGIAGPWSGVARGVAAGKGALAAKGISTATTLAKGGEKVSKVAAVKGVVGRAAETGVTGGIVGAAQVRQDDESMMENALHMAVAGAALHLTMEAAIPVVRYLKGSLMWKNSTKDITADDLFNAFTGRAEASPEANAFVRGLSRAERKEISKGMIKGEGVTVTEKVPRWGTTKPEPTAPPPPPREKPPAEPPPPPAAAPPEPPPPTVPRGTPETVVKATPYKPEVPGVKVAPVVAGAPAPPAAVKPPEPVVPEVEVDYTKRKAVKLSPSLKNTLEVVRDQVGAGEAGFKTKDPQGEWVGVSSSFPKFFSDKGYSKKETLMAIDKAIKGVPLGSRQRLIVEDLNREYRGSLAREARAERKKPKTIEETEVIAGNLEEGDTFKIKGKEHTVMKTEPGVFLDKITIKNDKTIKVEGEKRLKIDEGTLKKDAVEKVEPLPTSRKAAVGEADTGGYAKIPSVIEMPEVAAIAKDLLGGKYPNIVKNIRLMKGSAVGVFRQRGGKGKIDLQADIFKDLKEATNTLAHEIGHLVDWLPDKTLSRGNILGRVASLKKYGKHLLNELPTSEKLLPKGERARIRRKAYMEAKKQKGGFEPSKERVKELYKKRLATEIENRKLISRDVVMAELKKFTHEWKPFDAAKDEKFTKYRYSSKELYADALSALITNPTFLKTKAPAFYKAFFDYMERKPQVKAAYDAIQERISSGGVIEAREADLDAMLGEKSEAALKEAARKEPLDLLNTIKRELVDINAPIIKKVKAVKKAGREVAPEDNPIYWVEELPYLSGEYYQILRDINEKIIQPAKTGGVSITDIGKYQFLKRVEIERTDIANPMGHTPKSAAAHIDFLKKKWGDKKFVEVEVYAKEFREIRKQVLETLEKAEVYDNEFMELIKNSDAYVTFEVQKYLDKRYGRDVSSKIYAQMGTLQEITNPFVATMMKDAALLRAANTKMIKEKTITFLKENFPEDVTPADTQWNGKYKAPIEPRDSKLGMIAYPVKGKIEAYYVPKNIAASFTTNPYEAGKIIKALEIISVPLKEIFVGKNVPWALWNIQRDVRAFAKQLPGADIPKTIKYMIKAFPDAWQDVMKGKSTPDVAKMYKEKMLVLDRHFRPIEEAPEEQLDRILQSYAFTSDTYLNKVAKPFQWIWRQLDKPGKLSERVMKIAGYKYLKEQGKVGPKELGHLVRSRAGSPDFLRGGSHRRTYNTMFFFSNAGIGGVRAAAEAAVESPAGYAWKTVKYDLIPKLFMYLAGIGLLGNEVKQIMDRIPNRDKEHYITIPVGLTENGKAVYIVMPHDFQGQVVAGLAWDVLNTHKVEDMAGLVDYLGEGVPYSSLNPWIGVGVDAWQYATGKNPYNEWSGREVIPEQIFEASGTRSHKEFMKHVWNSLGGSVVHRFKHDDVNKIKNELEKIYDVPIAEGFVRRFVRVSDWGLREELREAKQDVRSERAENNLRVKDALIKIVNEEPLDEDDIAVLVENANRLDDKVVALLIRKQGRALVSEYMTARSNAEKAAVLKKWTELHNEGIVGE